MVVCYASVCMGCQCGPSHSLTLQAASAHYARSPLCFQSQMSLTVGIATAILSNRPSDAEQGDTGNSNGVELSETVTLARHMFTCLNYTCLRAKLHM